MFFFRRVHAFAILSLMQSLLKKPQHERLWKDSWG